MGFRTVLLVWPDEGLRLCGQGDANIGAGSVEKGGPCWRGPTEGKGFAGRATPTWAGARRDSGRPVGVARRRIKALQAGRRQHGRRQRGKGRALLAWPYEGLRLCREGDANMGAAAREMAGLVGGARRRIKALPAGRRQHGLAPGGIRGALLAWPASGHRRRNGFFAPLKRKGRSRRT